jgi:hypothetical protein
MAPVMRALGAVIVVAAVLDGVAAANLRDLDESRPPIGPSAVEPATAALTKPKPHPHHKPTHKPTHNPTNPPTPWMPGGVHEAARVCFKNTDKLDNKMQIFVGSYWFKAQADMPTDPSDWDYDPNDEFSSHTDLRNKKGLSEAWTLQLRRAQRARREPAPLRRAAPQRRCAPARARHVGVVQRRRARLSQVRARQQQDDLPHLD